MIDTNIMSALVATNGAPSVKTWARTVDEQQVYLSILTLGECDKGIDKLADDHPDRPRFTLSRDAIETRFAGRILSVGDAVVRRWGRISGRLARDLRHLPPVIDTLLAATAIEADLYLVTRNVREVRDSGAAVFNPWRDDADRFPISRTSRRTGG